MFNKKMLRGQCPIASKSHTTLGLFYEQYIYDVRDSENMVKSKQYVVSSVADPNPVGSGPFWSDSVLYPDVWDRIQIKKMT
jgi:hypothetical protein